MHRAYASERLGSLVTPQARYRANLDALCCLAELRDWQPSQIDLDRLAQYEGWADERVRRFGFDSAHECFPELRRVLGQLNVESRSLIGRAGLSAWITPASLARAIVCRALGELGRIAEGILIPGVGTGRFIEALTASRTYPSITAIESDPIFSRILSFRFRRVAEIRASSLQTSGLSWPSFDLVVGSAPDGSLEGGTPTDEPADLRWRHLNESAANYFVCKSVSLLRLGGICAMIVPREHMDSERTGVREWLAEHATLIECLRLPSDLWESQGSSRVADLLMWRKK